MSLGDITKLPTAGIFATDKVARAAGYQTTMYIGYDNGRIKSLTTSGTLAELTNKVKLPGRIVALVYTGLTAALTAVLADGRVYNLHADGSAVALIATLNMGVYDAFYYSNFLYVILEGVQQEKSSLLKIALA